VAKRNAEIKNFVLGALLGLGIGDKYHGPTERALVVGKHLYSNKELNILRLALDYANYYNAGGSDFGATQALSLGQLARGGIKTIEDIRNATYRTHIYRKGRTAGIGPAHRSVFLTVSLITFHFPFLSSSNWVLRKTFKKRFATGLAELSRIEASITHFDPFAGESSAFSNLLVAANILAPRKANFEPLNPKKKVLNLAIEFCEIAQIQHELISLLKYPEKISYNPHKFGYYFDTIACALGIWLQNETFEQILTAGWNIDRANYVGVLTGLWAGAFYGCSAIPQNYVIDNDMIKELIRVGKLFFRS
jgi:hypothetical protein